ncbi:MAG: undecaprenyl-phosphate glucose phosphotransferase [Thermoleophilia bacterium]
MTKSVKFFTSHRFSHVTLVVADMLGVVAGFRLAFLFYIQWGVLYAGEAAAPSYNFYLALAVVILPFYWLLFKLHGLYRFRLNLSLLEVLPAVVTAVTEASMVLLAITMFIFPVVHYSRNIIVISWISTIVCVSVTRLIVYMIFRWGRRRGWYVKNTLVLGAGKVGISAAGKIIRNPDLGLRFVGFLDEKPSGREADFGSYEVFDDYGRLEEVLEQHRIQHMVVGFSRDRHDSIVELMERCRPYSVEFTMVPRLYEIFSDSVGVEHIRGLPVLGLKRSSITGLQGFVKRTMDIVISLLVLIILAPLFLLVSLAIKLDSPGPVLYRQTRLGKNDKPFSILKFRSMRKDAEKGKAGWSTTGDVRRTRVGKLIRPLGIDELPQLINVIKGEMSLVGPRPERPEHVEHFAQEIQAYGSRHRVRPGLTGWAQINGLRGDTDISERVEHDIYYIENWNPWLDIKILLKTVTSFVDRDA